MSQNPNHTRIRKETTRNSLTPKQKWFKNISLTTKDRLCIGLDVHKKSISVAIWHNDHIALACTSPRCKIGGSITNHPKNPAAIG